MGGTFGAPDPSFYFILGLSTFSEHIYDIKKKIQSQTDEIENIKSRFKELKALVYEYKDNKETHINKLDEKQKKLEEEINNNSNDYNKLLENTTNQIEDFIKKNSSDKPTT